MSDQKENIRKEIFEYFSVGKLLISLVCILFFIYFALTQNFTSGDVHIFMQWFLAFLVLTHLDNRFNILIKRLREK